MIFRRISQHVRDQNWTAVGIDLVIVVVGVFIGIQMSNWNADRLERAQQRLVEQRIQGDIEQIGRTIERAVGQHEALFGALHTLRGAVARGDALPGEDAAIRLALSQGFSYPNASHRSATFVELQSSGHLGLISDDSLRAALVTYDRRAQQSRFNLEQIRNYIHADAPNFNRYKTLGPLARGADGEVALSSVVDYDLVGMAADGDFRAALDLLTEMQTWVQLNLYAEREEVDALLARMDRDAS